MKKENLHRDQKSLKTPSLHFSILKCQFILKGVTINPQIPYPITTSNRTATYQKEVKM